MLSAAMLLGGWAASGHNCFASTPRARPRAVLLAYTFGNNPRSCPPYFVRSFASLNTPHTDLFILHEEEAPPCRGELATVVKYVRMAAADVARLSSTGMPPAAYRLIAFADWLRAAPVAYEMAGVLDTDLIFQADIFDALHPLLTQSDASQVHLVSEDPLFLNGDCGGASISNFTVARLLRSSCRYATTPPKAAQPGAAPALLRDWAGNAGTSFWDGFGCSWRLNMGTMFGTRRGMLRLLDGLSSALREGPGCWDQGVLNVLAYTGAFGSVAVHTYFEGLVKTLDIGAVRDGRGRFYNERGAPYSIVHQFKPNRHKQLFRELESIFPPARDHSGADEPGAYCNRTWRVDLFPRGRRRVPVRDSLFERRLRMRQPGFTHPAAEWRRRGRNPESRKLPLPAAVAPEGAACSTAACVSAWYESVPMEGAFGNAALAVAAASSRPAAG